MSTLFGGNSAQPAGGGGGGGNNNNNNYLVTGARQALQQLKQQTASELGIQNYEQQYKGDLPSRVNGSVGGYMVKKMIALAESQLGSGAVSPATIGTGAAAGTATGALGAATGALGTATGALGTTGMTTGTAGTAGTAGTTFPIQ